MHKDICNSFQLYNKYVFRMTVCFLLEPKPILHPFHTFF